MGFDLTSQNQTPNPIDREMDHEGYYKMERFELHNIERFGSTAWVKILGLARSCGWEPKGTELSSYMIEELSMDPDDWIGRYTKNCGIVTADDAAALADALESTLDDIPDFDTDEKLVTMQPGDRLPDGTPMRTFANMVLEMGASFTIPNSDLNWFEFYSGKEKQHVIDFIAFCRKGGFEIG